MLYLWTKLKEKKEKLLTRTGSELAEEGDVS